MLKSFAGLIVGVCSSASALLAQSGWVPQDGIDTMPRGADQSEHVAMLGWQFHPITNGSDVVAFFATITGENAWGGNVKLMYFTYDSAGVWTSYGWEEDGTDGAVAWIRAEHGVAALSRSDIFADYATSAAAVAPGEMKDGFFVTDPNASILEELDEEQAKVVVEWLAEAGYKVAPKLSENLGVAGQAVLNEAMSYMTNQVEYTLYTAKTTHMNATNRHWCSCYTTSSTAMLPAPGPAGLDPRAPINPSAAPGGCDYHFVRIIGHKNTRSVGDYAIVCIDCTGSDSKPIEQRVTIRVPSPCTMPTPTNADPWS